MAIAFALFRSKAFPRRKKLVFSIKDMRGVPKDAPSKGCDPVLISGLQRRVRFLPHDLHGQLDHIVDFVFKLNR